LFHALTRKGDGKMTRMYMLAVLVSFFAGDLRYDTIERKTGEPIDGVFKQATPAGAVIEVGGQATTIPLEKVEAIYFGAVTYAVAAGPVASRKCASTHTFVAEPVTQHPPTLTGPSLQFAPKSAFTAIAPFEKVAGEEPKTLKWNAQIANLRIQRLQFGVFVAMLSLT